MELVLAEMSVTVHKTVLPLVPWAKKGLIYICCCAGQGKQIQLVKAWQRLQQFPWQKCQHQFSNLFLPWFFGLNKITCLLLLAKDPRQTIFQFMQLPKLGKYYSKLLFVKDGLTLVPWVEKVHLFVAVLAKDPRQTLFQFMQLPKLGKYCSKVIIKNVSSSCQRWSYLGSLG